MTTDPDQGIGERPFVDGTTRPVLEDGAGRQYVLDDDSNPVYGVQLPPADEPIEVMDGPMLARADE